MTTSHYLFRIKSRWQVVMLQGEDLAMFDSIEIGALPSEKYCTKLRSQAKKDEQAEKRLWDTSTL